MTRPSLALRFVLALTFAGFAATSPNALAAAPALPTVALTVNGQKIVAEVASTPDERATGLMHRFSLQPDHGMLFIFERPEPLGFWMKNTFIPLSIAFLDADGRILNIEDMAPQTENTHWSKGPALFALEMRKGWFVEKGVTAGSRIDGVTKLADNCIAQSIDCITSAYICWHDTAPLVVWGNPSA